MAQRPRTRRAAANQDRMRERGGSLRSRPDQIALWAFAMALVVLVAAAVSGAEADSGGVSAGGGGAKAGGGGGGDCRPNARFGARVLKRPDCGGDARTLNWILRSKRFQRNVPLAQRFNTGTAATVRKFQRRRNLPVNGILRKRPRQKLVQSLPRDRATWYGPGFWGNRTACGQVLRQKTRGVAHRGLPCGTKVVVGNKGRFVRTKVIDRGPYAHGADWDLTQKLARELKFDGVGKIRVARVR